MDNNFKKLNNVRKPDPVKPEDLDHYTVLSQLLSPTGNRYSYNRDKLPDPVRFPLQRELYEERMEQNRLWIDKANELKEKYKKLKKS